MKELPDQKLRPAANLIIAAILLLLPFHAFLTVAASQLVGHYTLLRLWKELLLAVLVPVAVWLLYRDRYKRGVFVRNRLMWGVAALGLLYGLSAVISYATHTVTLKAAAYGLLSGSRFLLWFMIVWVVAERSSVLWHWRYKLLLGPAAVVVVFGLLQRLVLPADILRHVGYSPETIRPFQTIDKKPSYFRIISTLRGANPLGAYLVVVLGVLAARFFAGWRKKLVVLFGLGALVALSATYSRSSWIGAFVAVGLIVAGKLKHLFSVKRAIILLAAGCVVVTVGLVALRNNDFVQNTFFHTDEHSVATSSSNHDHASATLSAFKQVVREPLGRGAGTAGQASVYNTGHPARIAENYYLQVGQETGWLGLGLFVAICVMVAKRLYALRQDPLALGLLASFIGLIVVNLLSHAWADDTLAYIWWGYAGLVLGTSSFGNNEVVPS